VSQPPSEPPWEPPAQQPSGPPPSGPPPFGRPPSGGYPGQPGYFAPPPSARRFSGRLVWAGIGLELLYLLLSGLLVTALSRLPGSWGGLAGLLLLVLALLPLIGGIVLAAAGRTTTWRSLGLGFAIGWGVWLIVGAGTCFAVVLSYGLGG